MHLFISWMRLSFQVDPKGKVPVKVISKTFASGKTEKLVYQCLSDLGLPNGKVRYFSESFLCLVIFVLANRACIKTAAGHL